MPRRTGGSRTGYSPEPILGSTALLASTCRPNNHGQTPSLVIGQSEPLPSKLLLQDTILLLKVFDDVLLVPIDPAGEGGEEDLPRL